MHVHNIWTFLHAERAFPLRKVRWFWYRLNCYWSTHEFYWALNDASVNGEDDYIRSWCCLKLKRFNTIVQYLFIVMSFLLADVFDNVVLKHALTYHTWYCARYFTSLSVAWDSWLLKMGLVVGIDDCFTYAKYDWALEAWRSMRCKFQSGMHN